MVRYLFGTDDVRDLKGKRVNARKEDPKGKSAGAVIGLEVLAWWDKSF